MWQLWLLTCEIKTRVDVWTALTTQIFRANNQRWNSADFLWNRADSELNSADFLWNSSETGNFQSKKISAESELFQRWFSLKQSWFSLKQSWFRAEQRWFSLKQRWNTKFSERKTSAESELFQRCSLWNRAEQRWYSLKQRWKIKNSEQKKTALNQCCFSADFRWNRADNHWSLLKQLFSFLILPWDNDEHPWNLSSISCPRRTFAIFLKGKLRYYAFWIIISYCFSANTRSFIFRETSAAKLKSYGFWELRSHYSAKKP